MIDRIIEKSKKENKKVCIYAHKFPDGDAISSSSALVEYFKGQGVQASYIVTNPVNPYKRIVGDIETTKSVDEDCISLIVDTSTLNYCENKLFEKTPKEDTFVIDHHMKVGSMTCIEDELELPEENVLRDSSASSTCEILIGKLHKKNISPKIAEMLMLGLLTDTAKLKFLKPNTLQNLQILLDNGVDYDKLISTCTPKSRLRNEVEISKIFLNVQKIQIGDTFGMILPVDHETVKKLNEQYGLKAVQKQIFKMNDITNCSFACMYAENAPGEFDLEFRSSSVYGNFNVQQLATNYGGGGHYNASGCHLSQNNGYTRESISSDIIQYVLGSYKNQAIGLPPIELTDIDKQLAIILADTQRLTKGVTASVLAEVDKLIKHGANYDYTFKTFKTFEQFMLENELLSRIPSEVYNEKQSTVNIVLSQEDVDYFSQKYNVVEDQLLQAIDRFSSINVQSAIITLPNGKKQMINNDTINKQNITPNSKTDKNIVR